MNKSFVWKSLLLCGVLGAIHLTPLQSACAATATAPACDPAYMTALEQRGWREAEREIQMNESLIFKPDSVFALSCFGNAIGALSPTFSNNASDVKNNTNTAVNSYMSGNFSHGYLGGATGGTQSTTDCSLMKKNWVLAKCSNLTATTFSNFAFASVSTGDKRVNNPDTCTTNPTATWTSTNTTMTTVGIVAGFDSANLFLKITDPLAALAATDKCAPGIPTGIEVGETSSTYGEKVCPNPGCVPVIAGGAPPDVKCCDQTNTSNRCDH